MRIVERQQHEISHKQHRTGRKIIPYVADIQLSSSILARNIGFRNILATFWQHLLIS
jgi:hypothetical protein